MSTNSAIEWTGSTWNPIAGCTPVSPGCLNCYAATMSHRLDGMGQEKYRGLTVLRNGVRTFNGKISFDEAALSIPLKRRKPETYFVNSMSDLFHEDVPTSFIRRVLFTIQKCPRHTFQVLTKRPERMAHEMGRWVNGCGHPVMSNLWLGTSCENQKTSSERIPHLLKSPAAVRFISAEPLLSEVNLKPYLSSDYTTRCPGSIAASLPSLDWVIVGGESGHGARPCNVAWVRSIVEQCKSAGVACFVKQLGSSPVMPATGMEVTREVNQPFMGSGWLHLRLNSSKGGDPAEWPEDLRVREMPRDPVGHLIG